MFVRRFNIIPAAFLRNPDFPADGKQFCCIGSPYRNPISAAIFPSDLSGAIISFCHQPNLILY